ncbi:hypothetical protein Sango_1184800 [Sesamum angolense]|uniref:Uncharacterized protein n=1 Tax=Sesamum angolense TaxID=2727404 RepID=A0AAE2BWX0_9LAMI|nr:hypothetical protein Sango_1184800 [Sesamum angolense]
MADSSGPLHVSLSGSPLWISIVTCNLVTGWWPLWLFGFPVNWIWLPEPFIVILTFDLSAYIIFLLRVFYSYCSSDIVLYLTVVSEPEFPGSGFIFRKWCSDKKWPDIIFSLLMVKLTSLSGNKNEGEKKLYKGTFKLEELYTETSLPQYVPDLAHNLISCSALEEEGLEGKWGTKGYRLWLRCQSGFKVIISRDVTFNKSEMPCLVNSSKKDLDFQLEGIFNKVERNLEDNQQGEEIRQENQHNSDSPEIETSNKEHDFENTYQLARDREKRESRIPSRYKDFHLVLNTASYEPSSYEEALKSIDSEKWIKAMNEEIKAPHDNNTWILVPKPKDVSIVDFSTRPDIAYDVSCLRDICQMQAFPIGSSQMATKGLQKVNRFLYFYFMWCMYKLEISASIYCALSTTEAEYIATTEAFKEAMSLEGTCSWVPGVLAMMMLASDTCGFGPMWKFLSGSPLWVYVVTLQPCDWLVAFVALWVSDKSDLPS